MTDNYAYLVSVDCRVKRFLLPTSSQAPQPEDFVSWLGAKHEDERSSVFEWIAHVADPHGATCGKASVYAISPWLVSVPTLNPVATAATGKAMYGPCWLVPDDTISWDGDDFIPDLLRDLAVPGWFTPKQRAREEPRFYSFQVAS